MKTKSNNNIIAIGYTWRSHGAAPLTNRINTIIPHRSFHLLSATANVDSETDGHIQQTLRSEFASCTVLVIAHRTETVADSDRILEMNRGEIASLAPPLIKLR